MTNYILGDIDTNVLVQDTDQNSFRPPFEHFFYENYPDTFLALREKDAWGREKLFYYDTARCRYIHDENECREIFSMLQKSVGH